MALLVCLFEAWGTLPFGSAFDFQPPFQPFQPPEPPEQLLLPVGEAAEVAGTLDSAGAAAPFGAVPAAPSLKTEAVQEESSKPSLGPEPKDASLSRVLSDMTGLVAALEAQHCYKHCFKPTTLPLVAPVAPVAPEEEKDTERPFQPKSLRVSVTHAVGRTAQAPLGFFS